MSAPSFPGDVGLSRLQVYPWETADGLHGGSPHMHLACTECYVVGSGRGRLQTLTPSGFEESRLEPGDVVWFTPGTIHRAVNDGDLEVHVIMQNSGLPEAGDAVLTFPPEHLGSADRYAAAVSLEVDGSPSAERARERRDLAVAGFERLVAGARSGNFDLLEDFYAAAAALVRPRVDEFETRWRKGALAAARATGEQLAGLRAGDHSHLRDATVRRSSPPEEKLGMCGFLKPYATHSD